MRPILLLIVIALLCCNTSKELDPQIKKEAKYFAAVKKNDIKLAEPKEGEWLYEHKEKAQSFEQYRLQNINRLNDSQNIIYLRPIGQFNALQQKALELTRQYLSIFYQTKTVLLTAISDSLFPKTAKRLRDKNNLQLLAPYVLDTILIKQVPKNSIALMAFTAKDLYPSNDWNYVFGLASYHQKVGVSSIYRLQNKHLDSTNFTTCLRRLLNVSSHEIGHMFTISHCTFAQCVMNGSNSLYETDLSPNRLCSECQKKLFWNIRYDNTKRLTELCNFFKANNLTKDYQFLFADLTNL